MPTSRFSGTEIVYDVKRLEMGISIKEIARKFEVREGTVQRAQEKRRVESERTEAPQGARTGEHRAEAVGRLGVRAQSCTS